MDFNPLFPGMVDTVGALASAAVALGLVASGRVRSDLGRGEQFWLFTCSLAFSALLCRVSVSADATALHIVPAATFFVCYLIWRGRYVSPGLAFALTYATCLPVDYVMAQALVGASFDPEFIGGGGWRDGLVVLPALNALAAAYGNWRVRTRRRAPARFPDVGRIAFH